jgi:hypothetical protein
VNQRTIGSVVVVLVGVLAVGTLATPRSSVIASSRVPSPQQLSLTTAGGSAPTIVKTPDGTVIVAWQQNIPPGKKIQQQIFARTSGDGINFDPVVNVSNSTNRAHDPYLFNGDGGAVHALYEQLLTGAAGFQIMNSDWISPTWTAPFRVSTQRSWTYQDPVGVQVPDGTFWFVTKVYFGSGTGTDAVVQHVGGSGQTFNLSQDGSAVRHPAIAEGINGQIYVGWLDHANERGGVSPGFKVRQWNGSTWTKLPDVSREGFTAFPVLAYHSGLLYAAWPSHLGVLGIRERIWDGSVWGGPTVLAAYSRPRHLQLAVSADGNVFFAWDVGGVVYLQENGNPPLAVSSGIPKAQQPALYVDQNDQAYIAFQNGAIWYVTVP